MQPITLWRRGLYAFRSLKYRFLWLMLVALILGIVIGTGKQNLLQAKEMQTQSASTQNAWQSASFPVENFQTYTSPFGYRTSPVDGSRQFHQGLDMAAPLGSYVRNWWTGRIVELSDNTGCGTMIKIQSGGWQHIYCHLMGRVVVTAQGRYLLDQEGGIMLQEGQDIPVGARIARVGMTGRTTGPHLHWGLKYNGNYLDPALVLQEMFRYQAVSQAK